MIFIALNSKYRKIVPSEYLFHLHATLFDTSRTLYPDNCIVEVPCVDGIFVIELSSGYPVAVKALDSSRNIEMLLSSNFETKTYKEFCETIRCN